MNSNLLDIKQLSAYLNVSVSLVRKLVRNKEIPHNRIGVKILFSKTEIDKWLIDHQINNEC